MNELSFKILELMEESDIKSITSGAVLIGERGRCEKYHHLISSDTPYVYAHFKPKLSERLQLSWHIREIAHKYDRSIKEYRSGSVEVDFGGLTIIVDHPLVLLSILQLWKLIELGWEESKAKELIESSEYAFIAHVIEYKSSYSDIQSVKGF